LPGPVCHRNKTARRDSFAIDFPGWGIGFPVRVLRERGALPRDCQARPAPQSKKCATQFTGTCLCRPGRAQSGRRHAERT